MKKLISICCICTVLLFGQEPHWVEPGRAVLYHHVNVRDYGRETDYGWQATNPLPMISGYAAS